MTDTLTGFVGIWRFQREIEDFRAGGTAHFEGSARFDRCETGLAYHEVGHWTSGEMSGLMGERRYHWSSPDPDKIVVFFDTGAFFHDFQLGHSAKAAHFCDPDQYDVSYQFDLPQRWSAIWQVTGPRKSYLSSTLYTPAS